MKRPASQFYWSDWLRDPGVRACSLAARGLWIDMLALMHEGQPYGHLTVGAAIVGAVQLARMVGETAPRVKLLLTELGAAGVYSVTDGGAIYSRRMVKDELIRNTRAAAGKLGGNPALMDNQIDNQMDNQMDNQADKQNPRSKDKQKPTPSSSSSSSSTATTTAGSTHRSVSGRTPSTTPVENSRTEPLQPQPQPPAPLSSQEDVNGNSDSDSPLPESATAFLHAFYRRAAPERQADVHRQLLALLTPNGATFEGSIVRAADAAHLAWACDQTIRLGPQDPDKAIVFVLKKLRDTYLETLSARHKAEEQTVCVPS